jgi:hypothetical protein
MDWQTKGHLRMETQAIAIELTKLVVAQSRPPIGADYFHLATDYLSIYRYILNDLHQHAGKPVSGDNHSPAARTH